MADLENGKISIKAVGDISPGDVFIQGLGIFSITRKYGVDYPFDNVRDSLKEGDIVLGNLEGLLTNKAFIGNREDLRFCGVPDFANALMRSGFNVMNVANNHTLEHGPDIFLETVRILQEAEIKVCGLRSTRNDYYSDPVKIVVRGTRFGILGYNWVGVNKFAGTDSYIAQSHDSLVNYTWNRDDATQINFENANVNVRKDLAKLKNEVDFVVLMVHWGYEFVTYPPYNVTIEASTFIDAGADIIIGSHPHVLQGAERYKNGLICYSLGNFIFDSHRKLPRSSAIFNINIYDKRNISYEYIPHYINESFQPSIPSNKMLQYIQKILSRSHERINSPDKRILLDDNRLYKDYEKYYNISKILAIWFHILSLREDPRIICIIIRKIRNFIKLMHKRLRGERIRW